MRLGFHYHIPFHSTDNSRISAPGYLGRFLDSIASEVDQLICFMHSANASEVQFSDYELQADNIRWINLGPKPSVPKRNLFAYRYTKLLRKHLGGLDAILIRGPSPLLPAIAKAAGDLPIALLLVGDYLTGIDDLPQPRWRKEAIRLWSYWNNLQQLKVAKRALTFVNSHKLYSQLQPHVPHLVETRTTTLSNGDFFEREDTCLGTPIRLLYTGRIDRAKGLFEMLEAVELLAQQGYDVVLDLVGWPAKGDTIVEEIRQDAQNRCIVERIQFHGYKAVGPELFTYYRQADIYVLASQSSEGFPRTIWEAMAHSLPIVATRVGSIPYYLKDDENALLVEPRNPSALAQSIATLIHSSKKRKLLIANGIELAKSNTLDARSTELISAIECWVK